MKRKKIEMFWTILKLSLLINSSQVFSQLSIENKFKASEAASKSVIRKLISEKKNQTSQVQEAIILSHENHESIIKCLSQLDSNTFHASWNFENHKLSIEGNYEKKAGRYIYSKAGLIFLYTDDAGLEIEIQNAHDKEFNQILINTLLTSIIYVPEFLQSFRQEMQKLNVSDFDSLGLASVKGLITCSNDLKDIQDARIKKALTEAISTLRNSVYFPN